MTCLLPLFSRCTALPFLGHASASSRSEEPAAAAAITGCKRSDTVFGKLLGKLLC